MSSVRKSFNVSKLDIIRAGEAAIKIKNILKSMNINPDIVRRIAICGYEGEMNMVMHGGDGELCVDFFDDKIVLDVSDNGNGIEDTELAMQQGYSTASDEFREMGFGAGMGLPNMNKNSDIFVIDSAPGKGTRVVMTFFLKKE
jgi:anti-sigma regulatory factor (Ser/Thr protein kinase)